MIIKIYEAKHQQNIFHAIVNVNSIVQYVIQIKNGKMIYANARAKIIVSAKNITFGILVHVFLKIVSIQKLFLMIQKLCVMEL